MKTLREQFEQYRIPVDERGWEKIANDPSVRKYNRARAARRAVLYSTATLVAAAAIVTAVLLTRPHNEPAPARTPADTQTAAPAIPDSTPTSTPAPAADTPEPVAPAKTPAPATQHAASRSIPAPAPNTPVTTTATQDKDAQLPAIGTLQPTVHPSTPILPDLTPATADPRNSEDTASLRTESDTTHSQQPQIADKLFFAPNAFSPNSDGVNDIFYVFANTEYTDFELNVYTRNGDHVFQSRHIENGWNGRRNGIGDLLPQGVYVYTIKYRTTNHTSGVEKGQILLIR